MLHHRGCASVSEDDLKWSCNRAITLLFMMVTFVLLLSLSYFFFSHKIHMSRQRLVIRQGKLKEIKIKNEIINRNRRNERDKYGKQSEEKTAQITLCFCNKLIMAIKKREKEKNVFSPFLNRCEPDGRAIVPSASSIIRKPSQWSVATVPHKYGTTERWGRERKVRERWWSDELWENEVLFLWKTSPLSPRHRQLKAAGGGFATKQQRKRKKGKCYRFDLSLSPQSHPSPSSFLPWDWNKAGILASRSGCRR